MHGGYLVQVVVPLYGGPDVEPLSPQRESTASDRPTLLVIPDKVWYGCQTGLASLGHVGRPVADLVHELLCDLRHVVAINLLIQDNADHQHVKPPKSFRGHLWRCRRRLGQKPAFGQTLLGLQHGILSRRGKGVDLTGRNVLAHVAVAFVFVARGLTFDNPVHNVRGQVRDRDPEVR